MKTRAINYPTDLIIGRSLITAETIMQELRKRLAADLADQWLVLPQGEWIERARAILAEFEPLVAEHLAGSDLAAWIAGYDHTAKQLPDWIKRDFASILHPLPPEGPPPRSPGLFGGAPEPEVRFPLIERAFESLMRRQILTRDQFDAVADDAKTAAFTIAGDLSEDTIGAVRDILVENVREGASLRSFRRQIEEQLETSPIGPGHLENVYRTNIQAAFRDGRETLATHPIVEEVFPYQEYLPIHDGRVRQEHLALGSLGLDGSGIYRRDDPMWDYFTPPWDFQCRCGVRLVTVADAARAGVREARKWLDSGRPPESPEWRLAQIPFEPNPGFGSRGRVISPILMAQADWVPYRGPRGGKDWRNVRTGQIV